MQTGKLTHPARQKTLLQPPRNLFRLIVYLFREHFFLRMCRRKYVFFCVWFIEEKPSCLNSGIKSPTTTLHD
jgi:hypothetical protein